MKEFFISHSSFLVTRNSSVYRFILLFSRHQFKVSMLQVLALQPLIYSRPRQHNSKCYDSRVSILFSAKEILHMKSS